ncbi:MAG TPA: HEPN domain-containing protein [Candidatus Bathyarchaeia archaeon]|nr:HEPN domain-containing protein [Candidatus Bathyarchaeia archaeon]
MAKRIREDAEWWLASAVDDYESAQLLFKGGKYSKCIHVLHNSAEKALKATILADRKRPPHGAGGHNLVRLYSMVTRRVRLSPKLVRTLDDLSPLYLPSEYPDAALGIPGTLFKKEQAQRYLREVGEVIRWLKKRTSRE